jgi:hypothetical protein
MPPAIDDRSSGVIDGAAAAVVGVETVPRWVPNVLQGVTTMSRHRWRLRRKRVRKWCELCGRGSPKRRCTRDDGVRELNVTSRRRDDAEWSLSQGHRIEFGKGDGKNGFASGVASGLFVEAVLRDVDIEMKE